jgi:hypothetical protein
VLRRCDQQHHTDSVQRLLGEHSPRKATLALFDVVRYERCVNGNTRGCFLAAAPLERGAAAKTLGVEPREPRRFVHGGAYGHCLDAELSANVLAALRTHPPLSEGRLQAMRTFTVEVARMRGRPSNEALACFPRRRLFGRRGRSNSSSGAA